MPPCKPIRSTAGALETAVGPEDWWRNHRPLILQTAALGPLENDQVSFAGFRVLAVKADVIEKVHYIPIQRLHQNDYRLSWEEAISTESAAASATRVVVVRG